MDTFPVSGSFTEMEFLYQRTEPSISAVLAGAANSSQSGGDLYPATPSQVSVLPDNWSPGVFAGSSTDRAQMTGAPASMSCCPKGGSQLSVSMSTATMRGR